MITTRGSGNLDFNKRYWYVKIEQYYPLGFLEDVEATCDTLEEVGTFHLNDLMGQYVWDSIKREFLKEPK